MSQLDLSFVDEAVARIGRQQHHCIALLQAIQAHYRYLPAEAIKRLCEISDLTPAQVSGVSTFYTQFRHSPVGKHIISVCHGTACHVKASRLVQDALMRQLGIAQGADTSADGQFTVQKVACLGCCTLAPVIQIDNVTYGHLTVETAGKVLEDFLDLERFHSRSRQRHIRRSPPEDAGQAPKRGEVRVGLGSCCVAKGSDELYKALGRACEELGLDVCVKRVGCVGMCHQTPMLEIVCPDGQSHLYARVQVADARDILLRHFQPNGLGRRMAATISRTLDHVLTDETWLDVQRYNLPVRDGNVQSFLGSQRHLASEHCGRLDPLDLEEYICLNGFTALRKCLTERTSQDVIDEITASGLRGRGGAGFPTGRKWSFVHGAAGQRKIAICNGDEGDPGAFMDRMILESYHYRVIEGLAIAAFATGCSEAIFYIRAEYPLAIQRVREALERCRQKRLVGPNILGRGFGLEMSIMEGAGAFVCGEETALIASIEGRRGMPRLRPPFPAVSGLWGLPTLVNNVETLAMVPWIIRHGASEFAALGTQSSKGTKVFALAGKVRRGGLIEVPMGMTLRQVVEDIGGGIAEDRVFKAVQVGGPSGGCVPAELCDVPIDYEHLAQAGAIMGSGGLVVLDDGDCMVDIARYFLEFTQDQSCGKCTFCRIGTRRMLDILNRLCEGHGHAGDLAELETLANQVRQASLCGLGRTAPNPVLTTLKYFRAEYEAHIAGRCVAKRCKALIHYKVTDDCIGCTKCAQVCPAEAVEMTPYRKHEIQDDKCIRCDSCRGACPTKAIVIES